MSITSWTTRTGTPTLHRAALFRHRQQADRRWTVEYGMTIPPARSKATISGAPLITDFVISVDDRELYLGLGTRGA